MLRIFYDITRKLFKQFHFGIEIVLSQKNLEGWMVGVWDGDCWDPSQRFWGLEWSSQQNPNKWNVGRCSIKLPWLCSISIIITLHYMVGIFIAIWLHYDIPIQAWSDYIAVFPSPFHYTRLLPAATITEQWLTYQCTGQIALHHLQSPFPLHYSYHWWRKRRNLISKTILGKN